MNESADLTNEDLDEAIAAGEKAKALKEERERPQREEDERLVREKLMEWKRNNLHAAAETFRAEKNNVYVAAFEPKDPDSRGDGTILTVDHLNNGEYEFSIFGNEHVTAYFEYKSGFTGSADEMRARFKGLLESIE